LPPLPRPDIVDWFVLFVGEEQKGLSGPTSPSFAPRDGDHFHLLPPVAWRIVGRSRVLRAHEATPFISKYCSLTLGFGSTFVTMTTPACPRRRQPSSAHTIHARMTSQWRRPSLPCQGRSGYWLAFSTAHIVLVPPLKPHQDGTETRHTHTTAHTLTYGSSH
jgi:hypothetical protein